MIGERLKRARAAAGLSMAELGERVGVSANMIKKYEHDESMPGFEVFWNLSQELRVPRGTLMRPVELELGDVEYRKRATAPKRVTRRIEADVLEQAERWKLLADLWPALPAPIFRGRKSGVRGLPRMIDGLDQVEQAAERVRAYWELGSGPIPDLTALLESRGILVIVTAVDVEEKFDGLQANAGGQPLIVIAANWPGDRQRFTLAHELGHLLLRGRTRSRALDEEKACNRFAGAFLLPAAAVKERLGERREKLTQAELLRLKQEYGLSMAGCVYRAADLGIIDAAHCRELFRMFSARGWRRKEPGPAYPPERTSQFARLVCRAFEEEAVGESKAAEMLNCSLWEFQDRRREMEASDAGTCL